MQGFLLVEQEELGVPKNTYQSRYFMSFPFCGLRWYYTKPSNLSEYALLVDKSIGGWVYGGNVTVANTCILEDEEDEEESTTGYTKLYYFEIQLLCNDSTSILRFGCKNATLRSQWLSEIEYFVSSQKYLAACLERSTAPSPCIFGGVLAEQEQLYLHRTSLNHIPTLRSIVDFCMSTFKCSLTPDSLHSLLSITLIETDLYDEHMPMVQQLIDASPSLQSLTLSKNFISCRGVKVLCSGLPALNLRYFDLSHNLVGDIGVKYIVQYLVQATQLNHFDLSHNRITSAAAKKYLVAYLSGNNKQIQHLNLSYNDIGEGASALVSLLSTFSTASNMASRLLSSVDVSYCGLLDSSIADIAAVLADISNDSLQHNLLVDNCRTFIRRVNLQGAVGISAATLTSLIDAIGARHTKFQKLALAKHPLHQTYNLTTGGQDQSLVVAIGGVVFGSVIDPKKSLSSGSVNTKPSTAGSAALGCRSLSPVSIRRAFTNLGTHTMLKDVVLCRRSIPSCWQRRIEQTSALAASRSKESLKSVGKGSDTSESIYGTLSNIVCMRVVSKNSDTNSHQIASEFLQDLAVVLGADITQFLLLSCSAVFADEPDDDGEVNCYMVMFTLLSVDDDHQFSHFNKFTFKRLAKCKITVVEREIAFLADEFSKKQLHSEWENIVHTLEAWGKASHPVLRGFGVRTVFVQKFHPSGKPDKSGLLPAAAPFHCHIVHKNTLHHKHKHHHHQTPIIASGRSGGDYLNPLSPQISPVEDLAPCDILEDEDDDVVTSIEDRNVIIRTGDDEIENLSGDLGQLNVADVQLDEESKAENEKNKNAQDLEKEEKNRQIDITEQLVIAIRKLYHAGEIESKTAKFWEGNLGNKKYFQFSKTVLQSALDEESGVYHAVYMRNKLCDAMHARDIVALGQLLAEEDAGHHEEEEEGLGMEAAQTKDYECTLILANCKQAGLIILEKARTLYTNLLCIQRDIQALKCITLSLHDMVEVESLLMRCATFGYNLPDIQLVIDARSTFVRWISQVSEDEEAFAVEFKRIQQKALLTNLMISRNVKELKKHMVRLINSEKQRVALSKSKKGEDAEGSEEGSMKDSPEVIGCRAFLHDVHTTKKSLKAAIESKDIVALENAVVLASYYSIQDDMVEGEMTLLDTAKALIYELSSDPRSLVAGIVNYLREKFEDPYSKPQMELYINLAGWKHGGLTDSAVIKRIAAQRKYGLQEESIKMKLVKFSLGVKNGFQVNSSELFQLLRRCREMNLHTNLQTKQSILSLEKHLKKFKSSLRMEELFVQLLEEKKWDQLTNMLNGRGTGVLVVSCSSLNSLSEWIHHINKVAQHGNRRRPTFALNTNGEESRPMDNDPIVFSGLMEKAARSDSGALRSWRQRSFALRGTTLTYYTKDGKDRKGSIRILGGVARQLTTTTNWTETGGRTLCLEIVEGIDLSLIDKDLLEEVEQAVQMGRYDDTVQQFHEAIYTKDVSKLQECFDRTKEFGFTLPPSVAVIGREDLLKLEAKNVTAELQLAVKTIPRSRMEELLRQCQKLNFLPSHSLYRQLNGLVERNDVEQCILRMSGAVEFNDELAYSKAYGQFQRFESKRIAHRDKRMLVAVILQHASVQASWNIIVHGMLMRQSVKLLRQGLEIATKYHVESEPVQLTRMLLAAADSEPQPPRFGDDTSGLFANDPNYAINKFSNLRSIYSHNHSNATSYSGIKHTLSTFSAPSDAASMVYTKDLMTKPLMKMAKGAEVSSFAVECFEVLQMVMGDRPIPKANSSVANRIRKTITKHNRFVQGDNEAIPVLTPAYLTVQVLLSLGTAHEALGDELYVQACKQVTNHPVRENEEVGWKILALYLHTFPPSTTFIPYLHNFLSESMKKYSDSQVNTIKRFDGLDEPPVLQAQIYMLIEYCSRLANASHRPKAYASFDREDSSITFVNALLDKDQHFVVSVELVTGSVCRLGLLATEVCSVIRILGMVFFGYTNIYPIDTVNALTTSTAASNVDGELPPAEDIEISLEKMKKLLRGFSLYYASKGQNIADISIQPDEDQLYNWNTDVLWDCLETVSMSQFHWHHRRKSKSLDVESSLPVLSLILRRRVYADTEQLASDLTLFDDGIILDENDIVAKRLQWNEWFLSNGKIAKSRSLDPSVFVLPEDFIRVDLLFAEEARYVNTDRYTNSVPVLEYLLGIQLALSWDDTGADGWAVGPEHAPGSNNCRSCNSVMKNTDISVRSCYKVVHRNEVQVIDIEEDTAPAVLLKNVEIVREEVNSDHDSEHSHTSDDGDTSDEESDDLNEVRSSFDSSIGGDDDGEMSMHSEYSSDRLQRMRLEMLRLKHPKVLLRGIDHVLDHELDEIQEKFTMFGVKEEDVPLINTEAVVSWAAECHSIAETLSIPVHHAGFRYMLKRAYLSYASTLPLHGSYFADGMLMSVAIFPPRLPSMSSSAAPSISGKEEEDNPEPLEHGGVHALQGIPEITVYERPAIIAVSCNGLFVLNPSNQDELILYAALWDIELCDLKSDMVADMDEEEKQKSGTPEKKKKAEVLAIQINGCLVQILTTSAVEVRLRIQGCILEMLRNGVYPHGTEHKAFTLSLPQTSDNYSDVNMAILQKKLVMKKYLNMFPLMAIPPAPVLLTVTDQTIHLPKSRRELYAQAREEEERLELERVRLAMESQQEKNMESMESGRNAINRYKATSTSNALEDNSDCSDDEANDKKAAEGENEPTKNKNVVSGEETEKTVQQRINNAVCGVAMKGSGAPRTVYDVPTAPQVHRGVVKIGMTERYRVLIAPPMLNQALNDNKATKSTVALPGERSWPPTIPLVGSSPNKNTCSLQESDKARDYSLEQQKHEEDLLQQLESMEESEVEVREVYDFRDTFGGSEYNAPLSSHSYPCGETYATHHKKKAKDLKQ